MSILVWLLRAIVFLLLLVLAVKNGEVVEVEFFFDAAWRLPLNLVMLLFFLLGALVGMLAALEWVVRQRREIGRLRREAREADALLARGGRTGQ